MADQFLASLLSRVTTGKRFYSAEQLINDIRNNIERILNSRLMIPTEYLLRSATRQRAKLLNDSLINFGIADIQSLNLGDEEMEKRFCDSVQIAIERYEPRISNVSVEMVPSVGERIVNISVKGSMVVSPYDEIGFQSGVEAEMQKFIVT